MTYLILNRFADDYSRYASYLDDIDAPLWLISTRLTEVPGYRRSDFHQVDKVDQLDWPTVRALLKASPEAAATVRQVVSVSEYDQELGAAVREFLGVPGYSSEYVRRFRDKDYSKKLVAAAGIRTPSWRAVDAGTSAESIEADWRYPVVVKPVTGAASSGVTVCHDRARLAAKLAGLDPEVGWEAETFIAGDLYHCDGFAEDGVLRYVSTSRYVGTCTAFNDGEPLGSVSIQHTAEAAILTDGTERALKALGLNSGVFHLEAFISDGEFVFLEIGHRPGGGEILPVVHRHGGVDLMAAAVRLSCGLPARIEPLSPAGSYGWLMCSAVGHTGQLVRSVTASGQLPSEITVVHNAFPGQLVPAEPEYDFTGLSAHVHADTPERAVEAIGQLLDSVQISYADPQP